MLALTSLMILNSWQSLITILVAELGKMVSVLNVQNTIISIKMESVVKLNPNVEFSIDRKVFVKPVIRVMESLMVNVLLLI